MSPHFTDEKTGSGRISIVQLRDKGLTPGLRYTQNVSVVSGPHDKSTAHSHYRQILLSFRTCHSLSHPTGLVGPSQGNWEQRKLKLPWTLSRNSWRKNKTEEKRLKFHPQNGHANRAAWRMFGSKGTMLTELRGFNLHDQLGATDRM